MKRTLLMAAMAAAALVSCSKNEVLEIQQDEIKFNVAASNATRAGVVATTTNSIADFRVFGWAVTSGKLYMDETYTRTSPSAQWTALNTNHYWPVENLDFYAVSPSTTTGVAVDGKTITDYVADGSTDLLYSVKMGQSKSTPTVSLNFRHALSQIVFKAKNTNEKLGVRIRGVKVVNVYSKNTLDLTHATSNTDENLVSDTGATTEVSGKWGTWGTASEPKTYEAEVAEEVDLSPTDDEVQLTAVSSGKDQGLLLMPQNLTPWNPDAAAISGSYFLITCKIWNKVTSSSTEDESIYLHGDASTYGTVAIPTTDIIWKQGTKYIYTFIFGEGAGYEEPDGTNPSDPILVPIKLSVTVDEFQSALGIDVTM